MIVVTVLSGVLPAAAQAAFSAPQDLGASGQGYPGFLAATDASGRFTVGLSAFLRAGRLRERAPGGPWSDPQPLPGGPEGARGHYPYLWEWTLAAAGDGALGLAWDLQSRPPKSSIEVAVRDPGGTLSDPIEIAGPAAAGVQHPAVAVDSRGDMLVAYNTRTSASHLRERGAIAIAYRPAGRPSFIGPTVVDPVMSDRPVVALADDGTGIVAWKRGETLMAGTIGSRGAVGTAKPIARRRGPVLGRPVVAAGPRSAASVAYRVTDTDIRGKRIAHHTSVQVLARPAGGTFGHVRRIFRGSGSGRDIALAADEEGRATLAFTQHTLDRNSAPGPGRVWTTAGRVGRSFGRPRIVEPLGDSNQDAISVAARHGHVALAWGMTQTGGPGGVEAATGAWNEPLRRQLIANSAPSSRVVAAVARDGSTGAFWIHEGHLFVSDGP